MTNNSTKKFMRRVAVFIACVFAWNIVGPSMAFAAAEAAASVPPPASPVVTAPTLDNPALGNPLAAGPRMHLLVFPLDSSEYEGTGKYVLGSFASKVLKEGLLISTRYSGMLYSQRDPTIARAVEENSLKQAEIQGPFGLDPSQIHTADKIAALMDMPKFLIGAVQDFTVDHEKRQATLTLAVEIIDTYSGKPDQTLLATGTSPASMTAGTDESLAMAAAENAANQIAAKLRGVEPASVTTPPVGTTPAATPAATAPKHKKSNSGGILAVLALVVGILIAGGGHGGGGGGGTGLDQPPAPPAH